MAQIQKDWFVFVVLDEIQAKYGELVKLVLNTESMDNNEKQYWFDILPSMSNEQIDRLFDILETERRKLEELEVKYQEQMKNLNEAHLMQWQEYQVTQWAAKVKEVAKAEQAEKKGENAEDVLKGLDL